MTFIELIDLTGAWWPIGASLLILAALVLVHWLTERRRDDEFNDAAWRAWAKKHGGRR